MGLDATPIGIQLFFTVILPGFMFFVSFRWTGRFNGKVGGLGSICAATFFGILIFWLMQASSAKNMDLFIKLLSSPLSAGLAFAIVGLVMGGILGIPIGWIRSRLY